MATEQVSRVGLLRLAIFGFVIEIMLFSLGFVYTLPGPDLSRTRKQNDINAARDTYDAALSSFTALRVNATVEVVSYGAMDDVTRADYAAGAFNASYRVPLRASPADLDVMRSFGATDDYTPYVFGLDATLPVFPTTHWERNTTRVDAYAWRNVTAVEVVGNSTSVQNTTYVVNATTGETACCMEQNVTLPLYGNVTRLQWVVVNSTNVTAWVPDTDWLHRSFLFPQPQYRIRFDIVSGETAAVSSVYSRPFVQHQAGRDYSYDDQWRRNWLSDVCVRIKPVADPAVAGGVRWALDSHRYDSPNPGWPFASIDDVGGCYPNFFMDGVGGYVLTWHTEQYVGVNAQAAAPGATVYDDNAGLATVNRINVCVRLAPDPLFEMLLQFRNGMLPGRDYVAAFAGGVFCLVLGSLLIVIATGCVFKRSLAHCFDVDCFCCPKGFCPKFKSDADGRTEAAARAADATPYGPTNRPAAEHPPSDGTARVTGAATAAAATAVPDTAVAMSAPASAPYYYAAAGGGATGQQPVMAIAVAPATEMTAPSYGGNA